MDKSEIDFNLDDWILDPFRGSLFFPVQKKTKIFEFGAHDVDGGCRRTTGPEVKYGLKLIGNGKVECKKELLLTPGITYQLETWMGGHKALRPGQIVLLSLCESYFGRCVF